MKKVEWWLPGARGMWSYYFMGTEFHFGKMKRVLEMDGCDVCTAMRISLNVSE